MNPTAIVLALACVVTGCVQSTSLPTPHEPLERAVALTSAESSYPAARACLVRGIDCLALDERPFTVCLLAPERCPQEAQGEFVVQGESLSR
jgi:hypothetical protein